MAGQATLTCFDPSPDEPDHLAWSRARRVGGEGVPQEAPCDPLQCFIADATLSANHQSSALLVAATMHGQRIPIGKGAVGAGRVSARPAGLR